MARSETATLLVGLPSSPHVKAYSSLWPTKWFDIKCWMGIWRSQILIAHMGLWSVAETVHFLHQKSKQYCSPKIICKPTLLISLRGGGGASMFFFSSCSTSLVTLTGKNLVVFIFISGFMIIPFYIFSIIFINIFSMEIC